MESSHFISDYYQFLEKTSGKIFNVLEIDLKYIEGLPNKDFLELNRAYFIKSYYYQMAGSYIFIQKKTAPIERKIFKIKYKNNFSSTLICVNEKN